MSRGAGTKETRELILDAAERLCHRYGYRKMTMSDVAEEARVSRPTVYLHFPSKEELCLGFIDRLHQILRGELLAIATAPGRPIEKLRRMLLTRVLCVYDRVPRDSRGLNDLFSAIREPLLERRTRWQEIEAQDLVAVLEAGREAGEIDADDPLTTARTLITATSAVMPFGLSPRELGEREALEQRAAQLVELLLRGVMSRG